MGIDYFSLLNRDWVFVDLIEGAYGRIPRELRISACFFFCFVF